MTPDAEGMLPEPDDPPPGFQSSRAVADDPSSQQDMDAAAPAPARSAPQQIYDSDLTFADLDLKPELLDALLLDMKYERPSKIQAKTLPIVLREPDRHMIAQGHNGSGKTTCFILAMLMRCATDIGPHCWCATTCAHLARPSLRSRDSTGSSGHERCSTAPVEGQDRCCVRPDRLGSAVHPLRCAEHGALYPELSTALPGFCPVVLYSGEQNQPRRQVSAALLPTQHRAPAEWTPRSPSRRPSACAPRASSSFRTSAS